MNADDLRRIAYQTPFKPFRVMLVNGESLDIQRSLRTAISVDRVHFGVDEDPKSGVARRLRVVSLQDISSVEVAPA